jgi:hypothetical protein
VDLDPIGSEIFSRIRIQNEFVRYIFMEDPKKDPELYEKPDPDQKKNHSRSTTLTQGKQTHGKIIPRFYFQVLLRDLD